MWTLFLLTAFWNIYLCYGGSSKYTWPLDIVNPVLETKANVTEGYPGCSYQPGVSHDTLQYTGIRMTGSSYSYIDVKIGGSIGLTALSITIYVMLHNTAGVGTIVHYKVDAVNPASIHIKDVILSNNETHLIAETFGSNGEQYGYTEAPFDATAMIQNWIGLCVSHDGKRKTRIITSTGNDIVTQATVHAEVKQPATIRFGSSFYPDRPSFNGNIICANIYDCNNCHLPESLGECTGGAWPLNSATLSEGCPELKGYFRLIQRDAVIDVSVTPISNKTMTSRVKCADLCLRTDLCWTYTFNKPVGECKIYDSDFTVHILHVTGSNYYIRRDVCC